MKYKLLKEYPRLEIGCIGEFQVGYDRYKFIGKYNSVFIDILLVECSPE